MLQIHVAFNDERRQGRCVLSYYLQEFLLLVDRHRELAYAPGEVRFVDAQRLPAPRRSISGYVKCTAKPPNC